MSYTVFSEKLQAIKCDRGEVYLWNPRLYYEKVLCPLCPGNPQKEITTPHFRKHLEQVHTIEGMILRLELLFSRLRMGLYRDDHYRKDAPTLL